MIRPGASVKGRTMNSLLLLRHAKSAWDDPSLADIDRPLASRGVKAAKAMGRELAARGWRPELVLVSPAVRTRETWALVAAELPNAVAPSFPKKLYMATPERLLQQLRKTPKKIGTVLLIGHNPSMEELAGKLAADGSDAEALARMKEKFPTAALARFDFDGAWSDLSFGKARLTYFLQPRNLD
jgi:phosphohistidine phosphatase